MPKLKKSLHSKRMAEKQKKKALILYDVEHEWWRERLSTDPKIHEKYSSIIWQTYDGQVPENANNMDILIFAPEYSDEEFCHFSEKSGFKQEPKPLQEFINESIENGWNRIHFQSCKTSHSFKHLEIKRKEKRVVLTGCKNNISAKQSQQTSTSDDYILGGYVQETNAVTLLSLVEFCLIDGDKKYWGKIKRRNK